MTPDQYFNALEGARKKALREIRYLIFEAWPDITECMDNEMPTYQLQGHTLCAIASQKSHMALYIMPYDLLASFSGKLKKYNMGRSCIRFKSLEADDLHLFAQIVKYTGQQQSLSSLYSKTCVA